MKSIFNFILILSFCTYGQSYAQAINKESVKVWGNCGMCKKTIEKAAKKAGAESASWDVEKQLLSLSYDQSKTSSAKIQEAIAKTGYDTRDVRADDEAYHQLHGCCQYERASVNESHPQNCCSDPACGKEKSGCSAKGCCKNKSCCQS